MPSIEIFNSPYSSNPDIWSVQGAKIHWTKVNSSGLVLNDTSAHSFYTLNKIDVQYQRPIGRLFALGSTVPIMRLGAPNGTVTLQNLFGPTTVLKDFIAAAGDECNSITLTIEPFRQACDNKQVKYTKFVCIGCKSDAFTVSLQTDQNGMGTCAGIIRLNMSSMKYDESEG